ncbi:NB-ARC - like 10 [Theobroma cacao]|nr:NB-ARC - like 10 [Theobroma cacao]
MPWEIVLAGVVGKALLSASLRLLFDKMASRMVLDFFREKKLDHHSLQTLKFKLLAVNSVLNDAEEQQHIMNLLVQEWLDELKDALYEAEDLFAEITSEVVKCDMEAGYQTPKEQVEALNTAIRKIVDRVKCIAEEKDFLNLKESPSDISLPRFPTTSLVNESEECFRNNEKELIVNSLLSDSAMNGNGIPVIAIAGMGGIGKTTLAQFVYNDERVKTHFILRAWAYVSERSSDVFKVTETIYESAVLMHSNAKDLNVLQVKLGRVLMGRKFLLVLDDMWNDSLTDWDLLQRPFHFGAGGSKIIVTTRNQSVSSTMHSVLVRSLTPLPYEDCWSIFAKHAFGSEYLTDGDSALESIGKKIVEKCQGLPLAAKALGGLLHSKVEPKEWDDGHEIEKGDLVRLWIAEGLVQQQKGTRRTVEVGEQYFDELLCRSFFSRSDHDSSRFKMHDLLNDLAQHIAGEFTFKLEDESLPLNPERVRHLSCTPNRDEAPDKFEAFYEVFNRLRTFLPLRSSPNSSRVPLTPIISNSLFPGSDDKRNSDDRRRNLLTETDDRKKNLFSESSRLRVLSLSPYHITNLPESIGNLKHLRYLDLSHTEIRSLHDRVCSLYNLETLKLSSCFQLTQLPQDMRNLTKLEHLDIKGSKVKEMPPQLGNLRSLQSLTTFVVSKNTSASRISELKKLSLLRGTLSIEGLQNVFQTADASVANLEEKKYLDELIFQWAPGTHLAHYETEVLDKLRPHEYLKKLRIRHFGGSKLPDWLGDAIFSQMVSLHLVDCENCSSLPPLGQLPCLQELYIVRMKRLRCVGSEFYGSNLKPFRSSCCDLETFSLDCFTRLVKLKLQGCIFLRSIELQSEHEHLTFLRKLKIEDCPILEIFSGRGLLSLQKLKISGCSNLSSFGEAGLPTNLQSFCFEQCRRLPPRDAWGLQNMASLIFFEFDGVKYHGE